MPVLPALLLTLALQSSAASSSHDPSATCGLFPIRVDSVARGVYVLYEPEPFRSMFYLEGNVTVIVNDRDAVVVDAGASPAVGDCLVRRIQRLTTKPVRYLVNTHWHGDHTLGNQAFVRAYPGIEIIASSRTRAGIVNDLAKNTADLAGSTASRKEAGRQMLADLTAHREAGADTLMGAIRQYYDRDLDQRQRDYKAAHAVAPTLIVDSALTIDRGRRTIRVFSIGKGDAPGTLAVYLPADSVLMTGDLVVGPIPFGFTAEPIAWRETLARIDSLPLRAIVPGHGTPQRTRDYLYALMHLVDTVTGTVRRGVAAGLTSDSIRAHLDAHALGAPFTHGDPILRFFFEQYFLDPFVDGVARVAAPAEVHVDPDAVVKSWQAVNRKPTVVDSGGMRFVRFGEAPGAGVAWTPTIDFADGEIELDVRGRDVFQKSFVGIAFRAARADSAEVVYLRPFNFQSTDSTRHAHAIQYTSYPAFPWERLRADTPGKYESAVLPEPQPNDWVHLRFVLRGTDLQVYVNRAPQPALHVQTLGGQTHGGFGLWVGDLSPGDFANITLRPAR
jgi:glyoxylase-like metal-dependent hydrolase (beta-lactamase superfamily II)